MSGISFEDLLQSYDGFFEGDAEYIEFKERL